jgi:multidrug resistance efflux pump
LKFIKDTKITIGMAMAVIMQASGVIWYIAQLDSNLTSLQTTIQVQAGQINTLNVQMSQLSKDFNISLNSEIDKLQEDQSYTKEKMSSIETKVSSLTDNGIKDDISFVKERVAYLEATSNDVIELENKLSTVKDDINNISNLMLNIENTLNDIEPNDYKYELDNLEYELKADLSNLDYSIDSLEIKLNEIEKAILNLERNNDFLYTTMVSQSELNQLKDEINLLKERVTWLEATPKY